MSGNIERVLYLDLAVVLLGLALTFYFSDYNNYRDYIAQSSALINDDRMVAVTGGKGEYPIKGTEVIHQLLEAKRLVKNSEVLRLYSDSIESSYQSNAEICICGRDAANVEISDVNHALFYDIEFDKDNSGRIIKVKYILR
ncbi:MAG: hypothetical protein GX022_04755 [Clostridiaceae bacterium]|nr:hypothetical protein [Clostridiaceae bacterium]